METKKSPRAVIKQIFASGKLTFIAVIFSIAAISAVINVFENRITFDDFSLMGFDVDLVKLLGKDAFEMLDTIADTIFIVSLIGVMPKVLIAVAFWLLKVGAKEGTSSTKISLIGLDFFKFNYLYDAMMMAFAMIGVLLAGILIIPNLGGSVGLILLALVLTLLFLYVFFRYSTNFLLMLIGVSNTMRTDVNFVIKSKQVIVFNYILAVCWILSSFGNGIWGIIVGICDALCIIFVNRMFAAFNREYGYATKEETKAFAEKVKTDPAYQEYASVLSIAPTYSAASKPSFGKTYRNLMFGCSVVSADGYRSETEQTATPAQNTASQPAKKQLYTRRPDCTDLLDVRMLTLFDPQTAIADPRYVLLGERKFHKQQAPVELRSAEVVKDTLSEKKILRLAFENASPLGVTKIKCKIVPKTNESSSIGILNEVAFEANAAPRTEFGKEYGILLPDETTCGSITVTYIEFADGMFRDKDGEEFLFSTQEKTEFDTGLYLSVMRK